MELFNTVKNILQLDSEPHKLTFLAMTLRAIIVFFASLIMVRLAAKRFLPHKTAFDAILSFVLASTLSRAINGSAAFFPTLGVGFVLIGIHRLVAMFACISHPFGKLVKGHEAILVRNGEVLRETLRKHQLTEEDLREQLRIEGHLDDITRIKEARFERSGEISVIKK
jgi:uncharacterized membrane protein YcaP (DUF421 family)